MRNSGIAVSPAVTAVNAPCTRGRLPACVSVPRSVPTMMLERATNEHRCECEFEGAGQTESQGRRDGLLADDRLAKVELGKSFHVLAELREERVVQVQRLPNRGDLRLGHR